MAMRQNEVRNTQNLMDGKHSQFHGAVSENMRQISDTVTYNIIQAFDVSSPEFNQQLSFLYDFNKDKIQSIACFMIWKEILLWQSQLHCRRMA